MNATVPGFHIDLNLITFEHDSQYAGKETSLDQTKEKSSWGSDYNKTSNEENEEGFLEMEGKEIDSKCELGASLISTLSEKEGARISKRGSIVQ